MVELAPADALALRMRSLLLADHPGLGAGGRPVDVAGVTGWFGALQAQDLASVQWSLGARLPGFTAEDVHAALERREALRTWPMRGTVHLIPPRDAGWMLEMMGKRLLSGVAARWAYLGLAEPVAEQAVEVLRAALAGGGRLTRAQCMQALTDAGIEVAGQRGYHLLWYASQRGVTCIGPNAGKEQTFVLLADWAPDQHRPDRDEALGTIAVRYFRSHGPTTRQDFAGWTGLPATDTKRGIAVAGAALAAVTVDGREMYLDPAVLDAPGGPVAGAAEEMLLLPGFDEYLLGYKDRALMFDPKHKQAIIPGGNGVFQPTIVRAGRVIGTWRRTITRTRAEVELRPLVRLGRSDRSRIEDAIKPYGHFIGRPMQPHWA